MKFIKYCLILLLLLVVSLTAYIYWGSIDKESFDDYGLLDNKKIFSPEENGFYVIEYSNDEDYNLIPYKDRGGIYDMILAKDWDAESASVVIHQYKKEINDAIRAASFPYIEYPLADDSMDIMNYSFSVDIPLMLILKSRLEAERGDVEAAISLVKSALAFTAKVKVSNDYLISYLIGLKGQNDVVNWLRRLSYDYPLSTVQLEVLLQSINELPEFKENDFKAVMSAELRFSKAVLQQAINVNLSQRWERYRNGGDYWNMDLDGDYEFGRENARQELYSFLSALFPKFYLHENEALSIVAKNYRAVIDEARLYCGQITTPNTHGVERAVSWSALLLPGSEKSFWESEAGNFMGYLYRRCFSYAHLESAKAILAIQLYQLDNGHRPASLELLVPKYLKRIPVDPFDGNPIRYSAENGWLYSLGRNMTDNGGSLDACFIDHCDSEEACKSNPTFVIDPDVCKEG